MDLRNLIHWWKIYGGDPVDLGLEVSPPAVVGEEDVQDEFCLLKRRPSGFQSAIRHVAGMQFPLRAADNKTNHSIQRGWGRVIKQPRSLEEWQLISLCVLVSKHDLQPSLRVVPLQRSPTSDHLHQHHVARGMPQGEVDAC